MVLEKLNKIREKKSVLRALASKSIQDFYLGLSASGLSFLKLRQKFGRQAFLFLREILPSHLKLCVGYRSLKYEFPFEEVESYFPQLRWAYPRVEGHDLGFYVPAGVGKGNFEKGFFGVMEPTLEHSRKILLSDCEAIIVPGLAYDRKLRRLGRGKGYYDRALRNFKGLKIGIGYSCQVFNEDFPLEKKEDGSEDIVMDFVVTEKFFFHSGKESFWKKVNL